jgi:isoleucyl-tRNA synthetase
VYMLAWTTTPWTLPGNVLLAVGHDIEYLIVEIEGEDGKYIVARDRAEAVLKDKKYKEVDRQKGAELVGLEYEPLFPYYKDTPNAFRVVSADFVSTTDGTGIVHIAPAFGEDDFALGKAEGLPLVQHVGMDGKFVDAATDFAGMDAKPKDDVSKTDIKIIKWLAHSGKLFSKEKIEHSYPHCWRCDTPLLNYATTSWFVRVTELKSQLLKNNDKINWVPEHIKEGRFGVWLEGARDWAISRSRYWGTPLPVWCCQTGKSQIPNSKSQTISNIQYPISKCDNIAVIGSIEEFEKLSGQKIADLHKHIIDDIGLPCDKCGGVMKRIPEVLDCWFESGSMPYGQMHYPFENKKKFEASFPAEFIAEGQDQTRGWFYTLHVLATALTMGKKSASAKASADKPAIPVKKSVAAFKNVIVNGIVLAEDGKKMSKRLKNYPEPEIVLEKYGADAMRYYLVTSPVMAAEAMNFSEAGVREMYNKLINTVYNVLEFYLMFANQTSDFRLQTSENVLDRWILAKLQILVKDVTEGMEAYKLAEAGRPIADFVTELSQWYVRRSRDRFKWTSDSGLQTSDHDREMADKNAALATLREVLLTLSKVMAPFTPFMAEKIYLALKNLPLPDGEIEGVGVESVHLEDWPGVNKKMINDKVIKMMKMARKVVEMGLALRAEKEIKVRQPLGKLLISEKLPEEFLEIISEELNVKKSEVVSKLFGVGVGALIPDNFVTKEEGGLSVLLDTAITDELKKEGIVREITRTINQIRKEQKLTIADRVIVKYSTDDVSLKFVFSKYNEEIKKAVLAYSVEEGEGETHNEVVIGGSKLKIEITNLS